MSTSPASVNPTPKLPRKRKAKLWLLLVSGLLVVGLIAGALISKKGKEQPQLVSTEKAVVRTITQIVTATGKAQPQKEVKISPEVAGELIALPFKEGAVVKKGQLIVKIKPDYYQAQVEQTEASLASAQASSVLSKAGGSVAWLTACARSCGIRPPSNKRRPGAGSTSVAPAQKVAKISQTQASNANEANCSTRLFASIASRSHSA